MLKTKSPSAIRNKGFLCAVFLLTLFCPMLSEMLLSSAVPAESPKEQYQKIQKEMELYKGKLEETRKREHSVLEEIDTVDKRLDAIETELKKQQSKSEQTEAQIRRVEAEISANQEYLNQKKSWMKRKLQTMQRYGQSYELFVLMSADDIGQMMRRWKYLEQVTMYERRLIDSYISTIKSLEERKKQLKDLRAEMRRDEERVRLVETTLSEKKKDRELILVSVRSERATHEKMLRELQEASGRLRDVIKKLEEKETYEARGFSALKGRLLWPVLGKIVIPYGSQKDPRFNTPVFRNGIYIKADDDAIKAVYAGKVVFAEWFKGYGNLLIVNHGEGYHTLYANLSEIFFKVGDIIKGQDVVGKAGESGIVNAPSLYFEIRYKGKPLDPVQWLKRK
ncbi:MAG: peptidoglycan DD-metalloendopeptidase family protein [Thermodesulfovibrionales bacterium]